VRQEGIRLAVRGVFDLRPAAIMPLLHLPAPIYPDAAAYGHFNGYKFSWENLDTTEELRKAVEKYADRTQTHRRPYPRRLQSPQGPKARRPGVRQAKTPYGAVRLRGAGALEQGHRSGGGR